MNMMYLEWVRLFGNDPVKVFCVSPGYLATGLSGIGPDAMRKIGALEPSMGGRTVKRVIEGNMDHLAGKVVNGRRGTEEGMEVGPQPW